MARLDDPVTITIRGKHDTGRTTLGILFSQWLKDNGYRDVKVEDVEPLPADKKPAFVERFERNRDRPVRIKIETELNVETRTLWTPCPKCKKSIGYIVPLASPTIRCHECGEVWTPPDRRNHRE